MCWNHKHYFVFLSDWRKSRTTGVRLINCTFLWLEWCSADYKYTTLRAAVSFRHGFQHACTEPFASLWGHSRSWLVCIKYRSSYLNDSDASDYAHAVIKARTLLAGWRLLWRSDKNYVKSGFIRNIKRPSPPLQKKKNEYLKQNLRINKGAHWIGNMDDKNSWQVSVVILQVSYFHGNNGWTNRFAVMYESEFWIFGGLSWFGKKSWVHQILCKFFLWYLSAQVNDCIRPAAINESSPEHWNLLPQTVLHPSITAE